MKNESIKLALSGEPIFFISDIHANLPALDAVLNEIPSNAPIICAGDILGYYTEPNEVCERLRSRSIFCIKGNHDKYILGELPYSSTREEKYRIKITRNELTRQNLDWLARLPDTLTLHLEHSNFAISVVHGSPTDVEEYIYPDTPILFALTEPTKLLVAGHTHHPMLREMKGGRILNPGSVGQVRDRTPGASYASVDPDTLRVKFFRASYSIKDYQERLSQSGITKPMIDIISRTN